MNGSADPERSDHVSADLRGSLFDGKGVLEGKNAAEEMDLNDPLMNWMMPTMRAQPDHPDSPAFCWSRAHAYDPNFIYRPDTKSYVPLTPDLARQFPPEWIESIRKHRPGLMVEGGK